MAVYYNEFDQFAAAWLRELIKKGLIADGEVDERSIADVRADDLRGFQQCHFFAGIGGWSLALRLAGWPDDRAVWTGSCPCQPFSSAGAQAGGNDSRDLWPIWFQLVKECRPVVVFGEQVEAAIGHGWLDRLCDDLEAEDYAVGPCGLPGPCVGAFDIRQRLWFVAESDRGNELRALGSSTEGDAARNRRRRGVVEVNRGRASRDLADTDGERRTRERLLLRPEETGRDASEVSQVTWSRGSGESDDTESKQMGRAGQPRENFWRAADWLPCADGKARPVEPGTFPLAHGVPARVGRLRGYGNAIKPQVAAEVIRAYMDIGKGE